MTSSTGRWVARLFGGTIRIRVAVGRHPKVPAGWSFAARRSLTRRCYRAGWGAGVRGSGRAAGPGWRPRSGWRRPSLPRMWVTCFLTVSSATTRSWAMRWFDLPAASSRSTSSSRSVSGSARSQARVPSARSREGYAPARVPPDAARTVGCRPPAPHPDLLAYRHLLACGQPAEDVQHGSQRGVRTSQAVLNGAQGLPLWFVEAHHHHVRGWGMSSVGPGCMSLVKTVLRG